MFLRKTLLAASAVALLSTPAWALADHNPSDQGAKHAPATTPAGPPSTTPNNADNPGASNRSQNGNHRSDQGNQGQGNDPGKPSHPAHPSHPSHPGNPSNPSNCTSHNVAYIVSGTLVSQTLSKNADGTYSGTLEVEVTHTNHHAVKGKISYPVSKVHVTFDNGGVSLADITAGDRVKAIGKITTLSKKCSQTGFTAVITIRKVIFHKSAK